MSYHVFFAFSQGLARPLQVPPGTLAAFTAHVREVEQRLGLVRTTYKDNHAYWDAYTRDFSHLTDNELCARIGAHNDWVRAVYRQLATWRQTPVPHGETLTPADAQQFWPGLELLDVPPERWTGDYYTQRMAHLYEVMRGRDSEGVSFDTKALTPTQAAAVIHLFALYLDSDDRRLNVPNGHDYLASSCDGGYRWCEQCGPMEDEDSAACRKRRCPLREEP